MLSRAQNAFQFTKEAIKFGSNNCVSPTQEAYAKVPLIQDLRQQASRFLYSYCQKTQVMGEPEIKSYLELMDIVVGAMLAKGFGCGNCHEQMATVLDFYLDYGIYEPIEIIGLEGDVPSNDYCSEHTMVIVNRSKNFCHKNPEAWENFLVIDPWLKSHVQEFNGSERTKIEDLAPPGLRNAKIIFSTRFEQNLNQMQWAKITAGLRLLQTELFMPKIFAKISLRNGGDIKTIPNDYNIIDKAICQKIELCQIKIKEQEKYSKPKIFNKINYANNSFTQFSANTNLSLPSPPSYLSPTLK